MFRTGWFMESIATQVLVIFVIRTRRNPLRSHPDRWLVLTSLAVVLLAMVGCAGLSPRLETPKLSIVGVELLKGELFEQRLRARMRVQNPNDRELAVKGITNAPQYVLGDQPKFTMVVTNIGLVACKRDVGAAVLAAYVFTLDNNRLWSNLDCAPSNETLVKTFNPGEQVTTEVTWTGMGSAPQCPLPREPIGAGTYNLVVQLGNLRSASVPFILADAPPAAAEPAPVEGEQMPAPDGAAPAPGG